jgi:hypothetical protein
MTILDSAQSSLNRLNKVREIREGVEEAQALQGLHSQFSQLLAPIIQCALNTKLLSSEGVKLSPSNEVENTIGKVKNTLALFEKNLASSTLTQSNRWPQLVKNLQTLEKNITQSQLSDWKVFFEINFFGGGNPFQKESILPKTPANESALTEYKILYQLFNRYKTNIPRNIKEYTHLQEVSYKLSQIQFQVGDDVPDAVQQFFAACNAGASLELLTIEVIEWLRKNNLLGSYVVRTRT